MYHELIKCAIELYIKQQLDIQRKGMWDFACFKALKPSAKQNQFLEFDKIFDANHIDKKQFAKSVFSILNKTKMKVNCLRLIGSPNSGKTLIANCIIAPFITCYMNNHGSENEFFASNMLNKSIILCEELYLTVATAEDFKSILGGQPIDVAKKFNEKQVLLRTPVILTSNHMKFGRGHLPPTDENALELRCCTYLFTAPVAPLCILEWQQFYQYLLSHVI